MKEIEKEKVIGKIHNFYSKLLVITLKPSCALKIGDRIRIVGDKGIDFTQKIRSMELNHRQVKRADVGDFIGIKVDDKAKKGCTVYLLVG